MFGVSGAPRKWVNNLINAIKGDGWTNETIKGNATSIASLTQEVDTQLAEKAIDTHAAVALLLNFVRQQGWEQDDIEQELIGEVGTVTLNNSETYPFNNSMVTVSLAKPRTTQNYIVIVDVPAAVGNVGEIVITDKLINGFKIGFTGSASSVTVKYKVIGGYLV